jgi:hypothetical protein
MRSTATHPTFSAALHVLAMVPQVANYLCLCDWERHAYRRGKKAFQFVRDLQQVVSSIISDTDMVDEHVRALWVQYTRLHRTSASAGEPSTGNTLSTILSIIDKVMLVGDRPRANVVSSGSDASTKRHPNATVLTETFMGFVGGRWRQLFTTADLVRGDWEVLPRVMRVDWGSGASLRDQPREVVVAGSTYIPICGISVDGSAMPPDRFGSWREVLYVIVPHSPFAQFSSGTSS